MKGTKFGVVVAAFLSVAFVGLGVCCAEADKPIELRVANLQASTHRYTGIIAKWAKRVEQETDGRLKMVIFSDASLLKAEETWTGTVQGVADIGVGWIKGFGKEGMNPYHWGPITWAAIYGAKDAMLASKIGDEIGEAFPAYAQELEELKILSNYSLPNLCLYSRKYAIRTLDDLKGRTVRTGNKAVSTFIEYAGGSPLFMAMGEVYLALQKGTIDIMAGYPGSLKGFRHAEVVKYVTVMRLLGGSPNLGFVGMNWNTWNKLPPDLKDVIDFSARRLDYEMEKSCIDSVSEDLDFARSKGNEIIQFPPEERAKIAEALKKLAVKEAQALDAKGLKGTDFMNVAYSVAGRYISLK